MKAFQKLQKNNLYRLRIAEQRARNRLPARNYAYLQSAQGAVFSECLVNDISDTGARIILPRAVKLPEYVMLRISGETTPVSASVAWQTGTKCGLQFNNGLTDILYQAE